MMKIVSIILQIVGVSAGAFIGLSLKFSQPEKSSDDAEHDTHAAAEDKKSGDKDADKGYKKKDKKKKDKKKKSKSGHGDKSDDHSEAEDSQYGFIKFSRQFIVPVIKTNDVNSLVVFDINLEVPPAATEKAYSREPKLRDALLGALLQLSNEGAFNNQLLEQDNIDEVRARLLAAAQSVLEDEVNEVLILSVARQDL